MINSVSSKFSFGSRLQMIEWSASKFCHAREMWYIPATGVQVIKGSHESFSILNKRARNHCKPWLARFLAVRENACDCIRKDEV